MARSGHDLARGLDALRDAVARALAGALDPLPQPVLVTTGGHRVPAAAASQWLLSEAVAGERPDGVAGGFGDADLAASSEESEEDRTRLIALVELARKGDAEAFGQLYDHYNASV